MYRTFLSSERGWGGYRKRVGMTTTICKLICENCGPSIILSSDFISVTKLGDVYSHVTRCKYCGSMKIEDIDIEMAEYLMDKGVVCNDWLD